MWRQLKDLGVVQIGDGLVGLPTTSRNRERLGWVAGRVLEAGGDAIVWEATPDAKRDARSLMERQQVARTEEYEALLADVEAEADPGPRTIAKWRRAWRTIDKRDYFDSPLRERTRAAIQDRADALALRDERQGATP